jgi:hypothetical protein
MRFFKSTTVGVFFLGLGGAALAVPPCPDRPTPPPCCADGHGYSRPETFGVYETRWRPWPIQNAGPGAPQTGEEALKGLLPRADLPPAEEEDRKAPPPSTPREEPPARVPAATNNATPGSETRTAPNAPMTRPAGEGPAERPAGPRQPLPPYEPQSPGGRSATGNGGTGESDPPPSLPFGPGPIRSASTAREANRTSISPSPVRSSTTAPANSSDDPPPALPGTLANLAG